MKKGILESSDNGMSKLAYFITCMCLTLFFHSAKSQILDTISASFHTKPKVFFQLDAYNSFVSSKGANTFGYKAGLEFNNRVKIGIGYYVLTSDIVKPKKLHYNNKDTTQNAKLEMSFIPLSFEYIFYHEDPWQLSVPVNLGWGKSYFYYYTNMAGDRGQTDKEAIALMTMNVDAQYKVIKWAGVGAGLGFRLMLKDNSNIHENFNSLIYSIQLKIYVAEIFHSLFPKTKD
ncbi:MAG: hypothetical protein ABIT08_14370 [Bacteroidia bacterium]